MPTVKELKDAIQDALNAQTAKFLAALETEKADVKAAIAAALAGSVPLTDADRAEILGMIDAFGTSVVQGVDTIQDPVGHDAPPASADSGDESGGGTGQ